MFEQCEDVTLALKLADKLCSDTPLHWPLKLDCKHPQSTKGWFVSNDSLLAKHCQKSALFTCEGPARIALGDVCLSCISLVHGEEFVFYHAIPAKDKTDQKYINRFFYIVMGIFIYFFKDFTLDCKVEYYMKNLSEFWDESLSLWRIPTAMPMWLVENYSSR